MKIILKSKITIEIDVPDADLQNANNIDRVKEFIQRNVQFSEILETMEISIEKSNTEKFNLQIN